MAKALPLPGAPDFPERFRRLTALEQAQALARGKRRHERKYPATALGGDRRSANFRATSNHEDRQCDVPDPERYGFTNFAAHVLGCTARSIQVTVRIAERIPPALQGALADTRIAERKNDLIRIAGMPPERHPQLLEHPTDVIADPDNAEVSTKPDVLVSLCGALYNIANDTNFDAIVTYAQRLRREIGEFLVTMSLKRDPELKKTAGFIRWAATRTQ